jgi:hypothetical protein
MKQITGKGSSPYALATAAAPRLTKWEQSVQDQKVLINILRNRGRGDEGTPVPPLKNDDGVADAPHATIETKNSSSSEEENNSALSGTLKLISKNEVEEAASG